MERILTEDQFEKFEDELDDIKFLCEDLQSAMEGITATNDDRTGNLDDAILRLKNMARLSPDMKQDIKPLIATLEQFTMEIDDCGDLQDLQMMEVSDYFSPKEKD